MTDDALLVHLFDGGQVQPIGAAEARDLLDEASDELADVSRRISGQYAEVMARFAARAFAGQARTKDVQQVRASITALLRLTMASGAGASVALLNELDLVARALLEEGKRGRRTALRRLRDWIPRFAETLDAEDGARLVRLVEWDAEEAPLLDELAHLRGIGPRRLERLYAAGLFTVDAVAGAEPADISSVTGIPIALSHRVVEATRTYAREERKRCVRALREHAARLDRIHRAAPLNHEAPMRLEVLAAIAEATRLIEDLALEMDP